MYVCVVSNLALHWDVPSNISMQLEPDDNFLPMPDDLLVSFYVSISTNKIPVHYILFTADITLAHKMINFQWDGHYYEQIDGIAMGSCSTQWLQITS